MPVCTEHHPLSFKFLVFRRYGVFEHILCSNIVTTFVSGVSMTSKRQFYREMIMVIARYVRICFFDFSSSAEIFSELF